VNDRLRQLFEEFLDEGLDAPKMAEFQDLLAEDPESLQEITALYQEHRLLGLEFQPFSEDRFATDLLHRIQEDQQRFVTGVTEAAIARTVTPKTHRDSFVRRALRYTLVVAATLLVSVAFQWLLSTNQPAPGTVAAQENLSEIPQDYIGTLVRGGECHWKPADDRIPLQSSGLTAGDRLIPGVVSLESGDALIQFDGGAALVLSGPATLEIETAGSATLRSGNATIRAPEEAAGFMLRTPTTDMIDLGTEFSVSVEDSGTTELHVTEGDVEWHSTHSSRRLGAVVSEGNAVRFMRNGSTEAETIPLKGRRFHELVGEIERRKKVGRLQALEQFDYAMQNSISSQAEANGGLGWNSHWYRGWQESDQILDFEPGKNLQGPPLFAKPEGGCLEFPVEQLDQHFREASKRVLADPIDMSVDSVRYISFLLHRDQQSIGQDNEWFRFMLVAGAERVRRLGFGVLSDRRPIIFNLEGNATSSKRIEDGNTYLFVVKIVTGKKRPDQMFLKCYGPEDTVDLSEPFEWTVSGRMVQHDEVMDEFHLYNGPDRAYWADEIRLGTSWESVTPLAQAGTNNDQ